jgi:hypothetical protein
VHDVRTIQVRFKKLEQRDQIVWVQVLEVPREERQIAVEVRMLEKTPSQVQLVGAPVESSKPEGTVPVEEAPAAEACKGEIRWPI